MPRAGVIELLCAVLTLGVKCGDAVWGCSMEVQCWEQCGCAVRECSVGVQCGEQCRGAIREGSVEV